MAIRALSIAATGMQAQQTNVEVISNNIANMNTTAYTRRRTEFNDLLYQDLRRIGATSSDTGTIVPAGVQLGLGVKTAAVYRINEQGSLTSTDNSLDLAIQGKGYFQVLQPDGTTAYTRAGNFSVNNAGVIVTDQGYQVIPQTTIASNATAVSISSSGLVQATIPGSPIPVTAGQLELATFVNEAGLEATGENLFQVSGASGPAVTGLPGAPGFGTVLQGYTEASNVDAVTEITSLIAAQRAYEMNSKVISTADQMMATAAQAKA